MRTRPRLRVAARTVRREAFNRHRLILAVKTAIAAAVAWYLAPWIPYADAEYSYYAPLGVLVSMHPTIVDSLKTSAQALAGLGLGIACGLLGLLLEGAGVSQLATLALVVAGAVALGGIRVLGTGGNWISIAALFVLLLGATDPDGFSSSYLFTMAFGALIGLVTNVVIPPPLSLGRASKRLSELRDATAAALDDIAERVERGDDDELEADLSPLLSAVREDVRDAERSRRGNPLGWRKRGQDENVRRLRALDDTVRSTIHLSDRVRDVLHRDSCDRALLATAITATARLVATPVGADEGPERLREADLALTRYLRAQLPATPEEELAKAHTLAYLGRIVDASRPLA